MSGIWSQLSEQRSETDDTRISYDWFVLALDLLYLLKAIQVNQRGLIRRAQP